MDRRKRIIKKKKVAVATRRRVAPPRVVRSKDSTRTPGWKSVVCTAVRQLTSYLPGGEVLKPLVDFGLKSFGFAQSGTIAFNANNRFDATSVSLIGLGSTIVLKVKDVLISDVRHFMATVGSNGHANYFSSYSAAKVQQVHIKVELTTPVATRQGLWGFVFIPFRTSDAYDVFKKDATKVPFFRDLQTMPGAVYGTARTLEVNYRFRVGRDGRLGTPLGLDQSLGAVCIAYDDVARNNFSKVDADEFSCVVVVSGRAMLSRPEWRQGYSSWDDTVEDVLTTVDGTILCDKSYYNYRVVKDTVVTRKKKNYAIVNGLIVSADIPSVMEM